MGYDTFAMYNQVYGLIIPSPGVTEARARLEARGRGRRP